MTDRFFIGPAGDEPPTTADLEGFTEITDAIEPRPELLNAARDAEVVAACVEGGVEHDYREFHDTSVGLGQRRVYLRCVWCHAVACGYVGQPDPCIEPWHHEPKPHRTKAGVTWPIGCTRPDQETRR